MPRLVLLEDNGRELFRGEISRANVRRLALFLRRNMGVFRAAAATARAVRELLGEGGIAELAPRVTAAAPARRRRKEGRS